MKTLFTRNSALAVVAAAVAVSLFGTESLAEAQDDDGFREIEGIPQTATGVFVSTPFCVGHEEHPLIMWTIEPSDRVFVSTNPPDLLTVKMNGMGQALSFSWNEDVASTATGGGVKIGFPDNRLGVVNVASSSTVQIIDGFKEIGDIRVSDASILTADLSSNEYSIFLEASGASTVTIKSWLGVSGGIISGASDVTVEGTEFELVDIMGASTVKFDGKGLFRGSVSGSSTLTATGVPKGEISVSGGSQLYAGSCDMVKDDASSSCSSGTQSVDVTFTEQPATKTGSVSCFGGGNDVGDVLLVASSGSTGRSGNSCGIGVAAVVAVAAGLVMV